MRICILKTKRWRSPSIQIKLVDVPDMDYFSSDKQHGAGDEVDSDL